MLTSSPPARADSGSPRLRVLVAEHDARVRRALVALLSMEPRITVVASCSNAEAARALNQALSPDVAVIGLLLPDANSGLALVAEVSSCGVAVAAVGLRDGLLETALAAGAAAYLPKDGGPDLLLETLLGVTGRLVSPAE